MSFTGNEGTMISVTNGAKFTLAYRNANLNTSNAIFFGVNKLQDLLNQNSAVGIRFYFGINENEELTLVAVAADSKEEDILIPDAELILDCGVRCPTNCDPASPLM
jgi:hypothetical protein